VKLAAVIGGERSWWACEEGVDEHAEGEREQALGDALDERGRGFGEVLFEPQFLDERLPNSRLAIVDAGRFPSRPLRVCRASAIGSCRVAPSGLW
jgi:hypothetical protein